MNAIWSLLASFLAGVAGSMGIGGGGVLLIYLTLFTGAAQRNAQGINLLFFLPTAALAVAIYHKQKIIRWKKIFPLILGGTLGALLTSILVSILSPDWLRKIFGAILILYGTLEIFRRQKENGRSDGEKPKKRP